MAGGKKFNWFAGVFTPSILTILGVIMYLRMGYVVGSSGLYGALFIIIVAHVISLTTGFSISSIATDKKVGAGGVYYVLSRSLGLPIGGAIGLTLFVGTAFSIALYLVGFAESASGIIEQSFDVQLGSNGLRIIASLALLLLTVLALISTSVAIKSQFFILAAIIISLVAIFFGTSDFIPETVSSFGPEEAGSFAEVFAIFFPAVTGFTAGIAMSGDLKDPKKSIPIGTLSAIFVGLAVYVVLAIFIAYSVDSETLLSNNTILMDIAFSSKAVIAGIWGATLSSALGGILGGPRILQAMSIDKITPKIFGKGVSKNNEPRNALILAVIIAEAGILIGELDMIARIVSMFYLAAYGFINISFFLESWASTDFAPTFKVNKWVGFFGFMATFIVMFQLDMLAMFAAFILIGGIYIWLARKQIGLGTGDVWQSVWTMIVKKGLHRMDRSADHKRNWKTNMLLFSGSTKERPHLLEFGKAITGQAGMVTNFDLIENRESPTLFPKNKQKTEDPELERLGIFGRQMEVQNIFKGIETICTTFGFSGIEPNTVLMGWQKNTVDPIWFAEMTQKLISLDYNVLYLDYDKRWGFKDYNTVDIWWRGISNNAELMLSLCRFLVNSSEWRRAKIRVVFVNNTETDYRVIKAAIDQELKSFRVQAEIKIINNKHDGKPVYELMKLYSSETDLVMIDIPDIEKGEERDFVERTNALVEYIGTTLLVKASSQFDETFISFNDDLKIIPSSEEATVLEPLLVSEYEELQNKIIELDQLFQSTASNLIESGFGPISKLYYNFLNDVESQIETYFDQLALRPDINAIFRIYPKLIDELRNRLNIILTKQLESISEILLNDITEFFKERDFELKNLDNTIRLINKQGKRKRLPWRKLVLGEPQTASTEQIFSIFSEFSILNYSILRDLSNGVQSQTDQLVEKIENSDKENLSTIISEARRQVKSTIDELKIKCLLLKDQTSVRLQASDRQILNELLLEAQTIVEGNKLNPPRKLDLEFKRKFEFVRSFAIYWSRNQRLFHHQTDADLHLNKVINSVNRLRKQIENHLQTAYFKNLEKNIETVEGDLSIIMANFKAENYEAEALNDFAIEEGLFFNPENITNLLNNKSSNISSDLPQEIEVMSSESINNFNQYQGEEVLSEKLVLDKITDYIIETKFLEPTKENIISTCHLMQQLHNELITCVQTFIIESGIHIRSRDYSKLESEALQMKNGVKKIKDDLSQLKDSYKQKLKYIYGISVAEMDIQPIIKEAEALEQFINKEKRRKGFDRFVDHLQKRIQTVLISAENIIEQKDKEATQKEFLLKHKNGENIASVLGTFISKTELRPELRDQLPFYYRQLFTGKHLNLAQGDNNRKSQIEDTRIAIEKINSGISGAIMITGESLSGKSFIVEQVVRNLSPSRTVYILASEGGSSNIEDLISSFQRAFNSKHSVHDILRNTNVRHNIVIEDLELWWRKSDNENKALRKLMNMITLFGDKHLFVLSSNLYSYKHLNQSLQLEKVLVGTIILPPLSHKELTDAIWVRHRLGNLNFVYKGIPEAEISERKMMKLMDSIYEASEGNVGLALRLWLSAIDKIEQDTIHLKDLVKLEFPDIERTGWKVLLFHLLIHRSMKLEDVLDLFHTESKNWVGNLLKTMVNSGVIEEKTKHVYTLQKTCSVYIEDWLYKSNLLR